MEDYKTDGAYLNHRSIYTDPYIYIYPPNAYMIRATYKTEVLVTKSLESFLLAGGLGARGREATAATGDGVVAAELSRTCVRIRFWVWD